MIEGHSIAALWEAAKDVITPYMNAKDIKVAEGQLMELHSLDARSDGFRYPFAFAKQDGSRQPLAKELSYASFDNFVWVLEGLCSWLHLTADIEQEYLEALSESAFWT
jgi:hypothetical protein